MSSATAESCFACVVLGLWLSGLSGSGRVAASGAVTVDSAMVDATQAWIHFKEKHHKVYASLAEERRRFKTFRENLKLIDERNRRETGTAVHGVTKFADMSQDEFRSGYLHPSPPRSSPPPHPSSSQRSPGIESKPLPRKASSDWSGVYTTPIKDQGYCGSCWAFSATEQVESDFMRTFPDAAWFNLSTQQVTSCTPYRLPWVGGCNGGEPEAAFKYAERGLVAESDYPYTSGNKGVTGACEIPATVRVQVKVVGYTNVASGARDEPVMAAYVGSTGPLSVVVDASEWSTYTGGVMNTCGSDLDHAVQVVGVDTGHETWKVRNSWGTSWGDQGYIYLKYGNNTCGIASDANYVAVTDASFIFYE